MKKTGMSSVAATFSLADFPSGARAKLEGRIIERALELWRKKTRAREKSKNRN